MKNLVVLGLLLLTGCATTLLSTSDKVYERVVSGYQVSCAVVEEWDTTMISADKQPRSCWCLLPPGVTGPYNMVFLLSKDEMCTDADPL